MSTKPIIMILVGLPGSGKSTFVNTLLEGDLDCSKDPYYAAAGHVKDYVVLSSDNLIEAYAKSIGKTYNEVFKEAIKDCEAKLKLMFQDAVKEKRNIIIDQTNMTVSKRTYILSKVPEGYHKIVVHFTAGLDIVKERLQKRERETGKHIPWHVMEHMYNRMEKPTLEEGFDEILMI